MSQQPLSASNTFPTPEDLKDIQGDVVLGFPKRYEDFVFFNIQDTTKFKSNLKHFIPAISTTQDIKNLREQIATHKARGHQSLLKVPSPLINIAFSQFGLTKLGIPPTASINDVPFQDGQLHRAGDLNDTGTRDANGKFTPSTWLPAFTGTDASNGIDGIVLIAGEAEDIVTEGVAKFQNAFGTSVKEVLKVSGNVRPGDQKGHEHFGFLDDISAPNVPGLSLSTTHHPGQIDIEPGVLIIGQQGDVRGTDRQNIPVQRPDWARNGSILCYRHLKQLVPEFEKFLADNPLVLYGLSRSEGSELFGARLVGRWKSGAPIDVKPLKDDVELANDASRNNDFDYSKASDQSRCPFAAHTRKANPRSDLNPFLADNPRALTARMIMRRGIPFGPEVNDDEKASQTTKLDRGLAFVCYQSNLEHGFEFVQKSWSNNAAFPPKDVTPGFDPIIGQSADGKRSMTGVNPTAQAEPQTLPQEWVVSKGGQYFFVPSITALKTKLTA